MRATTYLVFFIIYCPSILQAAWTDASITQSDAIGNNATYIQVSINLASADASVDIVGGCIGSLFVYGQSRVCMSGGRISNDYWSFDPENTDGDNVFRCPPENNLNLLDQSHFSMSGGEITGFISISANSSMDVFGYGLSYTSNRPHVLNGFWSDATPFSMRFIDDSYLRVNLNTVPEPGTILLSLAGIFSLRRK